MGSAVRKLTSESLAEALRKATTDEKQVAKAKIVGEMIGKVGRRYLPMRGSLIVTSLGKRSSQGHRGDLSGSGG